MAVLLGHFNAFIGVPWSIAGWFAGGYGVSFFFVLSGFILCYRYWEEFAPGVERGTFRRYFVARVARVYPSYAMALVLITLLYLLMNLRRPGAVVFPDNAFTSWLANLFALQTFAPSYDTQQVWNAPSWSISTELGFYLACPLILAAVARWCRSLRALLVLFALTALAGVAMQTLTLVLVFRDGWDRVLWLDIVASRNIFWRFPEFLTGVVAARLLFGGHMRRLEQSRAARNAVLALSVALVCVLNVAPWPEDTRALLAMRQYRLDLGYMIPFAGIVLALAAGPTAASPVLTRPSAIFLGDISYAVYIYHWIPWTILAHAAAAKMPVPPVLVLVVVVLTILFSAASYLWYEKPIRLYVRRTYAQ